MSSAIRILFFPAIIIGLLLFSTPIFAASNVGGEPVTDSNYGGPQNSNYALENLLTGLQCIGGFQPVGTKCLNNAYVPNSPTGTQSFLFNYNTGGALGALGHATIALYNPPTSTTEYIADLGRNLGLTEPVYAQVPGSGSSMIEPVFTLWQVMRNLSYILFILVFVVVGFMIMFRQKLNPQTVISVQTALPGLIIGLILVTFSYFIVALITDVAFYGIPLVSQIFVQTGMPNAIVGGSNPSEQADNLNRIARESNIFSLFPTFRMPFGTIADTGTFATAISQIFTASVTGGTSTGGGLFTGMLATMGLGIPLMFVNPALGIGGAVTGAAAPLIISSLIPVILMLALIVQLFRTFLALLTAYITIMVSTITGPIIILGASLPGRGGGLSMWWKTILANALIFPAVFGAILFAGFILASVNDPALWSSPPPLFGGLSTGVIPILVSYGILLATASVPDMVKGAFGIKDSGFGKAALAGFLTGFGVGKSGVMSGWKETGFPEMRAAQRKNRIEGWQGAIMGTGPRRVDYFNPATGNVETGNVPGTGTPGMGGATGQILRWVGGRWRG